LTAIDRHELEARYTARRIVELELDPVRGRFDAAHLKEVNRRIFQDLPALGFTHLTPGLFRSPVPEGSDWIKHRALTSVNATSFVAYSRMDEAARQHLDEALSRVDVRALSRLKTAEFTHTISTLYAELDYVHPFADGNSRTLRSFTKQLAREAGYALDWTQFDRGEAGRDALHIARDLAVNRMSMPHVHAHDTRMRAQLTIDQLESNRSLPDLLRDAIRPMRAVAFERQSQAAALEAHPELAKAYDTLRAAKDYFEAQLPGNSHAQQNAYLAVKAHVLQRLNDGETRDFRRSDRAPDKSNQQSPATQPRSKSEDLER
jgi:cell filamentation protein